MARMMDGGAQSDPVFRALVHDEIRAVVADVGRGGGVLRIADHVRRLHDTYHESGLSLEQITDDLIMEASRANIAMLLDQPK